jgi:cytochrome c5
MRPFLPPPARFVLAALGILVGLSACGSSSSTASSAAATSTTAAGSAASATASSSPAGSKVSANTASAAELTAALTANGVPNAARWTKEIQEYRPYPADDPTLARLRQNLEKYQPGDDVMTKILGSLVP